MTNAARTLHTFGDSVLDCAHYNAHRVHPGQLLVRNDDGLFPEFRGQDLASRGEAHLSHRAQDGATVDGLPAQARGIRAGADDVAIVTVGGNDLLCGLITDRGVGIAVFQRKLDTFVQRLPIRPVLLGNVYDPTMGDDGNNLLGVEPRAARANLARVNAAIAAVAARHGVLVDLHAHFLRGDLTWFVKTIEPSLRGASEVRRAFLPYVVR